MNRAQRFNASYNQRENVKLHSVAANDELQSTSVDCGNVFDLAQKFGQVVNGCAFDWDDIRDVVYHVLFLGFFVLNL